MGFGHSSFLYLDINKTICTFLHFIHKIFKYYDCFKIKFQNIVTYLSVTDNEGGDCTNRKKMARSRMGKNAYKITQSSLHFPDVAVELVMFGTAAIQEQFRNS